MWFHKILSVKASKTQRMDTWVQIRTIETLGENRVLCTIVGVQKSGHPILNHFWLRRGSRGVQRSGEMWVTRIGVQKPCTKWLWLLVISLWYPEIPLWYYDVINENTRFSRLAKAEMDAGRGSGPKWLKICQMKGHVQNYCYLAVWPLSGNLSNYF